MSVLYCESKIRVRNLLPAERCFAIYSEARNLHRGVAYGEKRAESWLSAVAAARSTESHCRQAAAIIPSGHY